MFKANIKYRVTLTGEEREVLGKLIQKENTAGCRIHHAQILLALDKIPKNEHRTDKKRGGACGVRQPAAGVLRKRFMEECFHTAMERKKRETPARIKIGGEAKIIGLACSGPPEGRCGRTLKLLVGKVAELGIPDSISGQRHWRPIKKKRT